MSANVHGGASDVLAALQGKFVSIQSHYPHDGKQQFHYAPTSSAQQREKVKRPHPGVDWGKGINDL